MTIEQQIEAVKQWLKFAEAWQQSTGDEPRLRDYEEHLRSVAQREAVHEIERIASSLLEDGFTREAGERIVDEIRKAGL